MFLVGLRKPSFWQTHNETQNRGAAPLSGVIGVEVKPGAQVPEEKLAAPEKKSGKVSAGKKIAGKIAGRESS